VAWLQHEAPLRLRQSDDLQLDAFNAFVTCGLCSCVVGIAIVGKCRFERLAGCLPNLACKLTHLRVLLPVNPRDVHLEQQAQRADSRMNLATSVALMTAVTRTPTTAARGLQRAAIQNRRTGLPLTLLRY
jgi:hypothetical protein